MLLRDACHHPPSGIEESRLPVRVGRLWRWLRSFYYLKHLPFDYFKIDGDLIRGIATSSMDQLVVGAIVGIARGMGKKTIAEFVTEDATVRLLEKAGVDYAQGYHIGRPRPLREVLSSA